MKDLTENISFSPKDVVKSVFDDEEALASDSDEENNEENASDIESSEDPEDASDETEGLFQAET